jgi:hypothetical protein
MCERCRQVLKCEDCRSIWINRHRRCTNPRMLAVIGARIVNEPPPWPDPQEQRFFFISGGEEHEGCYPNDLPACITIKDKLSHGR